ncbi:MAG: hypothetical protein IPK18_13865 [Sphingobacteriales bacterium]|nr:MAG: hypothetical protein IPK18_13865 [Sphingobacteriales bacterium]
MKKLYYIFLLMLMLSLTFSSCGKKEDCANCKAYIAVDQTVLLVWTIDSLQKYVPDAKSSDWCKLLENFNGQELSVPNLPITGTLNKSCE